MLSYMIGTLEEITANQIIAEVNGIGFCLNVSTATSGALAEGDTAKIHTHLVVNDTGMTLYGFATLEERAAFLLLTGVSGVGAKSALNILSVLTPSKLYLAIAADDADAVSKAQGVGKKTAMRICMELRDKIRGMDAVAGMVTNRQESLPTDGGKSDVKRDAVEALVSLGYGRGDCVRAVLEIAVEGMSAEMIIKGALKKLASFK